MGVLKGMIVALMMGGIAVMAMITIIGDFAREDTYNATLSNASRENLTAMYNVLSDSYSLSVDMETNISDAEITAGEVQAGGTYELGVPSVVGTGLAALNILASVPDIIGNFFNVVAHAIPAPLGYLFTGLVAIAGVTFVLAFIGAMLKMPDL